MHLAALFGVIPLNLKSDFLATPYYIARRVRTNQNNYYINYNETKITRDMCKRFAAAKVSNKMITFKILKFQTVSC